MFPFYESLLTKHLWINMFGKLLTWQLCTNFSKGDKTFVRLSPMKTRQDTSRGAMSFVVYTWFRLGQLHLYVFFSFFLSLNLSALSSFSPYKPVQINPSFKQLLRKQIIKKYDSVTGRLDERPVQSIIDTQIPWYLRTPAGPPHKE